MRVAPSGSISFRLDYRLNGRREIAYLGKYARDGISLARACELCLDARRAITEGRSSAIEKQREKRRSIFEQELLPAWRNRLLTEITPDDLGARCAKIVERGAPATAIHGRGILKQIYGFAILHGEKVANPADNVGPASIATFTPKDRALSPTEIRIMLKQLEHVATLPTNRLGIAVELVAGGGRERAVACAEDDDGDPQGASEAVREGASVVEGQSARLLSERRTIPR